MPIGIELMRHAPRAQLKVPMVLWIAQSFLERGSQGACAKSAAHGKLAAFPGPQPIHDPARGVGHRGQANGPRFDADESEWFGPQTRND